MKKKLIMTAIVLSVVAILVLLVPVPQFVEKNYHGENTVNGEQVTIEMKATYLHFLVLKDKIYTDITVATNGETKEYGDVLFYAGKWPSNNADTYLHAFSGWYFNDETVEVDYGDGVMGTKVIGSEMAHAYLSPDFNQIVLYHEPDSLASDREPKQFVGNTEDGKINETLEYFTGYVKEPRRETNDSKTEKYCDYCPC